MSTLYEFVVVGGGIVGLATALELQSRHPQSRIAVLEKEAAIAQHQTGHNSGVIHAGVYYAPGSMKARFCREGKQATRQFCQEHDIPFLDCGKLIVASTEKEVERLAGLEQRSIQNDIPIEPVNEKELRELEPHIRGMAGLLSTSTGIVNYEQVSQKMAELFQSKGGTIRLNCHITGGQESSNNITLYSNEGNIECDRAVICAGLYADRMIAAFGHTPPFQVIPFRGEYFRLQNQANDLVRHLIYPVPDPERPFLGVHLTRKLDGGFTVGPNAVLAFKREGYRLSDISISDMAQTLAFPGFWRMLAQNAGPALSELSASASKRLYLKRVQKYCASITLNDLTPYAAGVRAQAVAPDGKIIDDFLFVNTERCLHVGNAPSPAATSSIPIGRYIVDQLLSSAPQNPTTGSDHHKQLF